MTEVINGTEKLNFQLHHPSNQAHTMEIAKLSSSLKPMSVIPSDVGERIKLYYGRIVGFRSV